MAQLNTIEFQNIKLAVVKNKYYINYPPSKDNKLSIEFPLVNVAFDVNFSYDRPTLTIDMNSPGLEEFNAKLKETLVDLVYKNSKKIYPDHQTLPQLEQLYCPPYKTYNARKKFMYLKLDKRKLGNLDVLKRNTKVYLTVNISGLWISDQSFGPYINVVDVKYPRANDFLDESDSEIAA